jgi:hypothetical protein
VKKQVQAALYLLVTFLSLGWIVPLVLAVNLTSEGAEFLARGALNENSFPFFAAARQAGYLGGVWAAVAGAIWIGLWQRRKVA